MFERNDGLRSHERRVSHATFHLGVYISISAGAYNEERSETRTNFWPLGTTGFNAKNATAHWFTFWKSGLQRRYGENTRGKFNTQDIFLLFTSDVNHANF